MNTVKNFQGEILNLDHPETTLGVRMIFSNKTFRLLVFKDRPETHTRNFLSRSCHCATQQLKATGLEGADSLLETIRKPSYLLQEISNQLLSLSHCGFNFHTLRIKCLKEEIIITKEPPPPNELFAWTQQKLSPQPVPAQALWPKYVHHSNTFGC